MRRILIFTVLHTRTVVALPRFCLWEDSKRPHPLVWRHPNPKLRNRVVCTHLPCLPCNLEHEVLKPAWFPAWNGASRQRPVSRPCSKIMWELCGPQHHVPLAGKSCTYPPHIHTTCLIVFQEIEDEDATKHLRHRPAVSTATPFPWNARWRVRWHNAGRGTR